MKLESIISEVLKFCLRGLSKSIEINIDDELKELDTLNTLYKKYVRELDDYIKHWKNNARTVGVSSIYYEDTDSWGPSLDYASSIEILEYDGLRVSYDREVPEDLDLKLRWALEKSDNPIVLKLRDIENRINKVEKAIYQKYTAVFDELIENDRVRALFNLLTDMSNIEPLKSILEKYIDCEIEIPITNTRVLKFKPETLEELANKVKSEILHIIDPYDGCFGDLRELKDYKKVFIEFLLNYYLHRNS